MMDLQNMLENEELQGKLFLVLACLGAALAGFGIFSIGHVALEN